MPYDPEAEPDVPRDQRLQRAVIAARHTTIVASQSKPVQVRVPWSGTEDNALIDLIEQEGEEGISYATLKALDAESDDPKLTRRNAEDLRFKARNMKETFLK